MTPYDCCEHCRPDPDHCWIVSMFGDPHWGPCPECRAEVTA